MTTNNIKLLDVVALTVDIPSENLKRGQVGIVEKILADGEALEVEFTNNQGQTYNCLVIEPFKLMVLHFQAA